MSLGEPYTRDILRLAAAIPGQVGFGELVDGVERRSRTCGSRVRVAVELDDEGRVADFRQAVEACAYGQAAAALMGARAVGLDLDAAEAQLAFVEQWLRGDLPSSADWPELASLEPALERPSRHEVILLPFRALVAAIAAASR
ncbi:MAG TPA: iron-sulfur cluster assembly scaffold protein [Sphingomicrobium sp.]|nr:iron-sulfur cluster assembly scaffold protein [Sphingomicrobium sp.]